MKNDVKCTLSIKKLTGMQIFSLQSHTILPVIERAGVHVTGGHMSVLVSAGLPGLAGWTTLATCR